MSTLSSLRTPFNLFLIYFAKSLGLYFGILELNPVPIPSEPLINTIGRMGQYDSGSILYPSSSK